MKKIETIVLVADLAGTAVFAAEGAITAMRSGLDLLGVMVLSFAVALGGGVIRDLLIGATPPNAVRDWRYPALAFLTGLLTFIFHNEARNLSAPLLMALDAAGLALFAVAGAQKALSYGIGPFISALMGMTPAWAAASYATSCWPACPWFSSPISMRARRLWEALCWRSAAGSDFLR